jgi:hypothetical protein
VEIVSAAGVPDEPTRVGTGTIDGPEEPPPGDVAEAPGSEPLAVPVGVAFVADVFVADAEPTDVAAC